MYNILGELKENEKKFEDSNLIEIKNVYSVEYMREDSKIIRLLVDLAKHSLLLIKEIEPKNIKHKPNKKIYRSLVNRKDINSYLNAAYDTKSKYFVDLIIESLHEMGFIIGKEAQHAIEIMILNKFMNISNRLARFKNKKYFVTK